MAHGRKRSPRRECAGGDEFADLVRIILVLAFIAFLPHAAFLVLFSAYTVSGIVQTTRDIVSARSKRRRTAEAS